MKVFLDIRIWMGLVHMPTLKSYWLDKRIYKNEITSFITKNRFQYIPRFWHFSDDVHGDRINELRPLRGNRTNKISTSQNPRSECSKYMNWELLLADLT